MWAGTWAKRHRLIAFSEKRYGETPAWGTGAERSEEPAPSRPVRPRLLPLGTYFSAGLRAAGGVVGSKYFAFKYAST
jgi:hypothetical protein